MDVSSRITGILMNDEEVEAMATQKRFSPPASLNPTPDSVVLTNRRFIVFHPKLLGGFTFEDWVWKDLKDAQLSEEMMSATISISTIDGRKVSVDRLPKEGAHNIYRRAQEMEEKMVEKRREREMEEKRAGAANIRTTEQ